MLSTVHTEVHGLGTQGGSLPSTHREAYTGWCIPGRYIGGVYQAGYTGRPSPLGTQGGIALLAHREVYPDVYQRCIPRCVPAVYTQGVPKGGTPLIPQGVPKGGTPLIPPGYTRGGENEAKRASQPPTKRGENEAKRASQPPKERRRE